MINKDNVYILTRKELKTKGASMFAEGTIVKCGKYYIHISYGNGKWRIASMETTVNTETDLRNLPIGKQPQYIRDFIRDYNICDQLRYSKYKIGNKVHHLKYNNDIDYNRIDIITDITFNVFGDLQYKTEEISKNNLRRKRIGCVYEKYLALAQ